MPGASKVVLVVEDDPDIREVLEEMPGRRRPSGAHGLQRT
jgi:CheY-like chemotaxis protein